MAPAASSWYPWEEGEGKIMVDFLLPTGVIVSLEVFRDATLAEIKQELWKESQGYPLYSKLMDRNTYIFMCVNQMAEKEELWNEERRLIEIRPFQPLLKIVDKPGNKEEKILKSNISFLIGKGLHEFDKLTSLEVSDFRVNLRRMARETALKRDKLPWEEKAKHLFPPDVASKPDLPPLVRDKLINNNFLISVKFDNVKYTIMAPATDTPTNVIEQVLQKRATGTGTALEAADQYVLKVSGKEEFFLGDYHLGQYKYLRKTVVREETPPLLLLVSKNQVLAPSIPPRPSTKNNSKKQKDLSGRGDQQNTEASRALHQQKCLWDENVKDKNFSITINKVTNVSYEDDRKLILKVGLYHGSNALCGLQTTSMRPLENYWIEWIEKLTFDIKLQNIPRAARLCFALYILVEKKNRSGPYNKTIKDGRQELLPIWWVNIPVFDYRDSLRSGQTTLYAWPVMDEDMLQEEVVNPIGTVEFNPDVQDAVSICLTFDDHGREIVFPPFDQVLEVAAKNLSEKEELPLPKIDRDQHLQPLRTLLERDPLVQLHEQEIETIWNLRLECRDHYPNALPRLLSCVQWHNHIHVSLMQALLQIWPVLTPPVNALELLDFAYADKCVRHFAVKCLKRMSDSELCQYLLQLVQVLKYESYLECDLVEFLLFRALNNQVIGHHFFWLLRSEMHVPSVSVRFGLILEAYCYGNQIHMRQLTKQVQALESLRSINMHVKDRQYSNLKAPNVKSKALQGMRSMLEQPRYSDVLHDLQSTLDPFYRLARVKSEKCKFMDSKMRPLWLVWQNNDTDSADIYTMYKNGDDLRQDMLTLQILRVMDNIWQEEGLDLKLNLYGCLPTGRGEGVIEIVLNSTTIANIQKQYTKFNNKECMYKWLKQHNENEDSLKKAVEDFTLSCAGYCVATYVLGIGDRHSDNILLTQNGQLFHIDFGHILGNFKSFHGVKRERVPFVLVTDFVFIIQQGNANQHPCANTDNDCFKRFEQICQAAYLAIRQKTNLLMTLFMMMMNTGIPELSTEKDIKYLQDTLVPHLSDEDALKHFQQKFKEALQQSWKTHVNWFFHNMAKDNTA